MKNNKIFTGNIMLCTKYNHHDGSIGPDLGHIESESIVHDEDAVLIRTKHGFYVNINGLSLSDIAYLYLERSRGRISGTKSAELFMLTSPSCLGELFVDSESVKPYMSTDKNKSSSIRHIQNEASGMTR